MPDGNQPLQRDLQDLSHAELLATVRRLLAEADALSTRIAAVNEIGLAVSRNLDLRHILSVVSRQAKWLLDFDYCGVCLRNDDELWDVVDLFGKAAPLAENALLRSSNLSRVLKGGCSHLSKVQADAPFLQEYASQMILPLLSDDQVIGAICFAARRDNLYTYEDLRIGHLLSLQLSAALRNARYLRDLRMAEEGLRRYAEQLERQNAELNAYSHTIAHDLKSPLATVPIMTYIARKAIQQNQLELALSRLDEVDTSAERMSKMIDQLLWLAKLRDPAGQMVCTPVRPVAEAAVQRFKSAISERGIRVEIAPDLPPVLAHEQWLEEVFANLISNAIKYIGADNPQPCIRIFAERHGSAARYLVADNGLGIPAEQQHRLFEMFTRLHEGQAEGLGLGLSIVQRIIANLKGRVGVESEVGQGSTFWFELPSVC